jgi:hypothetical protein
MTENELRIGNYVLLNEEAVPVLAKVCEIRSLELRLNYHKPLDTASCYNIRVTNKCSAILLSETWLIKLGFTKKIKEPDEFQYWQFNGFEIWQHAHGFCHDIHLGGDVETVYYLQNLYYVIMQQDLSINI